MNLREMKYKNILIAAGMICTLLSVYTCQRQPSKTVMFSAQDSVNIIRDILVHRAEVDSAFRNEPDSPFRRDSSVHFTGVKWFPPDLAYYFKSKLYRYDHPETVSVYGTKGEERKHLKYGYFMLPFSGKEYRLNVYKFTASDPVRFIKYRNYLSVWFTDQTTGKQTYNVGRYVDVEDESSDSNHLYTINLNNAYNPYCAYTHLYSCAIPPKEDYLDFAVLVGEMKYHP
jgi:uncharacterized protein